MFSIHASSVGPLCHPWASKHAPSVRGHEALDFDFIHGAKEEVGESAAVLGNVFEDRQIALRHFVVGVKPQRGGQMLPGLAGVSGHQVEQTQIAPEERVVGRHFDGLAGMAQRRLHVPQLGSGVSQVIAIPSLLRKTFD